ncbi:helix-turn-helix transcriptional regulator [Pelosinus sp. IPA-1]|uniref:helix-turn-helix domain-containing protein n=1 Tax=Pelosinus sp. IPA-1 TaxID=3029569 RepID=UPI0024361DC2|nr:helix-turn-helix transcriptional regulator [Pelosinus sp. IPA-1]GMB00398.1 hypothetical protein PIPA1_31970 [Pelosinus sp. IPA-1]
MSLGKRIKLFRNQLRKSQKEIESITGIPQTTLSGWENDNSEPAASDIIKLASVLRVTVNDLLYELSGEDETSNPVNVKLVG